MSIIELCGLESVYILGSPYLGKLPVPKPGDLDFGCSSAISVKHLAAPFAPGRDHDGSSLVVVGALWGHRCWLREF